MNIAHLKLSARILILACVTVLAVSGVTFSRAAAQTKTADSSASLAAYQQKQLNQLRLLTEQLQKDRDAVDAMVDEYGWDSDEADTAQQRLFQDRQEYRSLRRSLQATGVSIPSDAMGGGTVNQSTQNGHCCGHRHGHHGCCGGVHVCSGHDGDHCCDGHGN